MDEEIKLFFDDAEENMNNAIKHLESELTKLRAGKANPQLLDGVIVDYYGVKTPLSQISSINTPDARTIMIKPWEKKMVEPVEKAIMQANLGFNPQNNGELIRIVIPALTEERRIELVKQVKKQGENTKVSIRNARRDANDAFKELQKEGKSEDIIKNAENEIQKTTDLFIEKIDNIINRKEQEIMTI